MTLDLHYAVERGLVTRDQAERIVAFHVSDGNYRVPNVLTISPNNVIICQCGERTGAARYLDHSCPSKPKLTAELLDLLTFIIKSRAGACGDVDIHDRSGVYAIRDAHGNVKFGKATYQARVRLTEGRIWNAHPLELVAIVSGDPEDERPIHRHFADHHVSGEWFRYT